jgi:hypothetical protein
MVPPARRREGGHQTEAPRLRGYGPALLIQGGVLFAFDLVMMAFHLHRNAVLPTGAAGLEMTANPGGFTVLF